MRDLEFVNWYNKTICRNFYLRASVTRSSLNNGLDVLLEIIRYFKLALGN